MEGGFNMFKNHKGYCFSYSLDTFNEEFPLLLKILKAILKVKIKSQIKIFANKKDKVRLHKTVERRVLQATKEAEAKRLQRLEKNYSRK